jgi:hypothetical protein
VPSCCPRSSLPAKVLGWLAARLAHLNPPRRSGQGGTRPLALEVRLDAVAAVILDGLSYRRAGRMVGISKTEVGDSMDLLLGPLADLGFCQPDGTFITSLDDLGQWLEEMARAGEAVCLDVLATRVQRPRGWANQKVLYDAKRHSHTAQGLALSTVHGDLLLVRRWLAGQLPRARAAGAGRAGGGAGRGRGGQPVGSGVSGHGQDPRALARAGRGPPHQGPALTQGQRAYNRLQAGLRTLVEQSIANLANAWALRRWRGLLYRVRDVYRAAGALVCLCRWLHRVAT